MGSLPSPPRPVTPPPSPQNFVDYLIYVPFCRREPAPNANNSIWIDCYNPLDNTWTHVSSIPIILENHVLKGFAMVSIGRSIYIIGGRLCRKQRTLESDDFVEKDVEIFSSVLCYDLRINQWSNCAPLRIPRYDFACTVCENKIYVAGGQSTLASARGISSGEVYDPTLDSWTPLPNMNRLRYKCVGVTWHGKIHVVGGFAVRGDSDKPGPFIVERSSAEVFDPINGKWDLMAKMWQLDVPPNQIVSLEGKLYSSGDCLNAWKGHIEAYDEELEMWNVLEGSRVRTLACPISASGFYKENWPPVQRLCLTMAPIGKYLFFLANCRMSEESLRITSMVHRFDTSATSGAWRSFEPMEEEGEKELCSHCCVVQIP